ncbi:hypothetical protein [Actinospongicola halichondriae]|uniref:hypothetical protein n=1 Tax=Actinospongicola halichondriae TaxID=3236844 RepID=UPI003D4EFC20
MADDDLVRIECGTDRFAAHTLLARCRAEGVQAELLTSDAGVEFLHAATQPFVLLVHADDVDAVRAIATGEPTPERKAKLDKARRRRTGG